MLEHPYTRWLRVLFTLEKVILIDFLLTEVNIVKFLWEWLLFQFQVLAVHQNVCRIFNESRAALVEFVFILYMFANVNINFLEQPPGVLLDYLSKISQ